MIKSLRRFGIFLICSAIFVMSVTTYALIEFMSVVNMFFQ